MELDVCYQEETCLTIASSFIIPSSSCARKTSRGGPLAGDDAVDRGTARGGGRMLQGKRTPSMLLKRRQKEKVSKEQNSVNIRYDAV